MTLKPWNLPPKLLELMDGWTSIERKGQTVYFYSYEDALLFHSRNNKPQGALVFAVSDSTDGSWWSITPKGEITETHWERGLQVYHLEADSFDVWLTV